MSEHLSFADERTGRTDTEVGWVEVTGVEGWTFRTCAARTILERHPGAKVLAVWPSGERGRHGARVWNVEYELAEETAS